MDRMASGHGRRAAGVALALLSVGVWGASAAGAETYVVKGGENSLTAAKELESALAKANANAGANTIVLGSGGYEPTEPLKIVNKTGLLTIEGPADAANVKGAAADISGSDQTTVDELLLVETGVSVKFKNVYITGAGGEGFPAIEALGANEETKVPGASVTIEDSTLATSGSGINLNPGSTLVMRNSTVAHGGATGLVSTEATATIENSTIADNKSGGINNTGGSITLKNTIVADNKGGDCAAEVKTSDHSLDSDGSCGVGTLSKKNPDLSSGLLFIGGSTPVLSVKAGSPVIGAGDSATCLTTDQRGAPRPGVKGDACDIGADEYSNEKPVLTVPGKITVTAETAGRSGTAIVNYEVSAVGVNDAVSASGLSCNLPPGFAFPIGETPVTCTAIDGHENKTEAQFVVVVTEKGSTTTTTTTTTKPTTTTSTTTTSTTTATTTTKPTTTTTTTTKPTTTTTTTTKSTTTTKPTTTTTTTTRSTTTTTKPTTTTTTTTKSTTTTTKPTTTTTTTTKSTTTTTKPTTTTTTTTKPATTTTTTTRSTTTTKPTTTTTTSTKPTTTTSATRSTMSSTTTTTTHPTTTTTTTTHPTTTTTTTTTHPTTTTTTTTSTTAPGQESAEELLEELQLGAEGAPIPPHLSHVLAGLLYDARVTLEIPSPWFFPDPSFWHTLTTWQAEGDVHVFIAVIEQDQLTGRKIEPWLAQLGIQLANHILMVLEEGSGAGRLDLF